MFKLASLVLGKLLLIMLCCAPLHGLAAQSPEQYLFSLINQRLSHMEDVALYKVQNSLPIEDIAREEEVIAQAKLAAAEAGLIADSVEQFFTAQISVAKAIQRRFSEDWLTTTPTRAAIDLQTEVRPLLTVLGDQIIAALANVLSTRGSIDSSSRGLFHRSIVVRHTSEQDKDLLFEALLLIESR